MIKVYGRLSWALALVAVATPCAVSVASANEPAAALEAFPDDDLVGLQQPAARSPAASGWDATTGEVGGWDAVVRREPRLTQEPRPARVPKPQQVRRTEPAALGAAAASRAPSPLPPALGLPRIVPRHAMSGIASFYWQGHTTASGEPFNKDALTAAHPTLPFGTKVRVRCRRTGRDVVVRINDRGPFKPGRVIDLSEGAAEVIGMRGAGLAAVHLEVVSR